MESRFSAATALAVLLACLSVAAASLPYGRTISGEGTYYGTTEGGHCALRQPRPPMYASMQAVALNSAQYGNSLPCGACLEYTGNGDGSGANPIVGTHMAYVMDECPSCADGDIDLSMSGDGRWKVSWRFVPCPGGSVSFLLEGSNAFYKKIQPRGMKGPALSFAVNGVQGTRKMDNFFEFHSSFPTPATAVIRTVLGETLTVQIPYWVDDGAISASGTARSGPRGSPPQKGGSTKGGSRSGPRGAPPQKTGSKKGGSRSGARARCVPRWRSCAARGRRRYGTAKCCGRSRCQRTRRGKRCVPRRARARTRSRSGAPGGGSRCVPRWKACSGRNNVWRTSSCCGGYRCVVAGTRTFVGKRCEPRA